MTNSLKDLGFSQHFQRQWTRDDPSLTPFRITSVHRDRLSALSPDGPADLTTPHHPTGDFAVGDWVLADPDHRIRHLFQRQTELTRRAAGTDAKTQLIAANVDMLFITTSCNADFNPARLQRYLVLAQDAGCFPLILLTKKDLCDDPRDFEQRAQKLGAHLPVLLLDARDPGDLAQLAAWCGSGQTAALVGMSGVGKSTIRNGLVADQTATRATRQDDRGRHTTTARELVPMTGGGWLIDTPGMRALRLVDADRGIDGFFSDISALSADCRFTDCRHETEPGCAVQAAIAAGDLDPDRLSQWRKLRRENARHSETLAQSRARDKDFGRMIREVKMGLKNRKGY
jgi:ribosome biogenesis GTPase